MHHPLITTSKILKRASLDIRQALEPILIKFPVILNIKATGIYTQPNALNVYVVDSSCLRSTNVLRIDNKNVNFNLVGSDLIISNKVTVFEEEKPNVTLTIEPKDRIDLFVKLILKILELEPNFCDIMVPSKIPTDKFTEIKLEIDKYAIREKINSIQQTLHNFYLYANPNIKVVREALDYLIQNKIIMGSVRLDSDDFKVYINPKERGKLCSYGPSKLLRWYNEANDKECYIHQNDVIEFFTKYKEVKKYVI